MQSSNLLKSIATMAGAAALAQLISFAMTPILSRLYAPSDFGTFATVIAASTVLVPLSTARYELAVMLPAEDSDADALAGAALAIALTVAVGCLLALAVSWPWIAGLGYVRQLGGLIFAIPIIALFIAIGQVGSFLANRQGRYSLIASAGVAQQLAYGGSATALGLLGGHPVGLVAARCLGFFAYGAPFGSAIWRAIAGFGSAWSVGQAIAAMQRYRQFPTFNLPYSLVGGFSRDFLLFALTAFTQLTAAGYFGLARTILTAPITLLSSALSQVYYREAVSRVGQPEFARFTFRMLIGIALCLTPGCALLTVWAPDVFATLFGERWRGAGEFAMFMAVPASLSGLTSWPERVFEVRAKQHWALGIQLSFDATTICLVVTLLVLGSDPITVVIAYSSMQCLFHLVYLGAVFRLASLGGTRYLKVTSLVALVLSVGWLVGRGLEAMPVSPVVIFMAHAAVAASFSATGLVVLIRNKSAV